jgi:hypothetical protein
MEKLSRHLWSMLLFVYSPPTKNSAVDSLCQYHYTRLRERNTLLNLIEVR